jgi:hypothetical protein
MDGMCSDEGEDKKSVVVMGATSFGWDIDEAGEMFIKEILKIIHSSLVQ